MILSVRCVKIASARITYYFADIKAHPEYLPVLIREADAPANIAAELIIAAGQRAIFDKEYEKAELLINALDQVVTTGKFENPLATNYLDIVLILKNAGYETLSLDSQGEQAKAQVTNGFLISTSLELEKINGSWQVLP
jgi:hypothetical protein